MKLTHIALIFSLLIFLQACGPSQSDLNTERRAEIIAVHDEVMPKLGQLKSFEKSALDKSTALAASDSIQTEQIKGYQDLANELSQAYEEMFVWMRQYEVDDKGRTPEEVKVYLDEQMILVTEVNTSIKDALAKADSLLAN